MFFIVTKRHLVAVLGLILFVAAFSAVLWQGTARPAFLQQQASAQEQLEQAEKELEQAQRDLDALDESKWYLLDRDTNMGYVSYSMDADRMGNLASVFPLIFFLVAALVCLTTMTRMVEEQRTSIGCLKALGYSQGAIALKYVSWSVRFLSIVHHIPSRISRNPFGSYPLIESPLANEL